MTQFMLIVGDRVRVADIICHSLDEADNFIKKIASKSFTSEQLQRCWYPKCRSGGSTHELFARTHLQLQSGISMDESIIGRLLKEVSYSCDEIAIWYADDCENLTCFTDIALVMSVISSILMDERSAGDIYLRYSTVTKILN